ncbi:hypothetical protein [Novosphingobium endophyticum]|uniref:hypothetical protein n=1 Tax=Novosphingobium endophyticum TaxID=1955250 RepID=UPI00166CB3A1|nr:hypothetical protein [Novosphingobium endophyticum]
MRNGQCFLRPNPAVLDIVVNNSGVITTEDFGADEKKPRNTSSARRARSPRSSRSSRREEGRWVSDGTIPANGAANT